MKIIFIGLLCFNNSEERKREKELKIDNKKI